MTLLNSCPSSSQKSLEDETVCGCFNSLARRCTVGRTGVRGTALPSAETLSLTTQHSVNHDIPWRSQNMDTHTQNSSMVSWYPLSNTSHFSEDGFLADTVWTWSRVCSALAEDSVCSFGGTTGMLRIRALSGEEEIGSNEVTSFWILKLSGYKKLWHRLVPDIPD